jgi:hypothetical protein
MERSLMRGAVQYPCGHTWRKPIPSEPAQLRAMLTIAADAGKLIRVYFGGGEVNGRLAERTVLLDAALQRVEYPLTDRAVPRS